MNNIALLKAQSKLALTQIDPRLKIGIENYIAALENVYRASVKFANEVIIEPPHPEDSELKLSVDPQDVYEFEKAVCLTMRAADAPPEPPLRGMVWQSDEELPTGV